MESTQQFPRLYSSGGEVCPDEVNEMWRQKRRWHLEQHLHCRRCLEAGKTVTASIATHVKPLRGNIDVRTFLHTEVHSLCADCNRHEAIAGRVAPL